MPLRSSRPRPRRASIVARVRLRVSVVDSPSPSAAGLEYLRRDHPVRRARLDPRTTASVVPARGSCLRRSSCSTRRAGTRFHPGGSSMSHCGSGAGIACVGRTRCGSTAIAPQLSPAPPLRAPSGRRRSMSAMMPKISAARRARFRSGRRAGRGQSRHGLLVARCSEPTGVGAARSHALHRWGCGSGRRFRRRPLPRGWHVRGAS